MAKDLIQINLKAKVDVADIQAQLESISKSGKIQPIDIKVKGAEGFKAVRHEIEKTDNILVRMSENMYKFLRFYLAGNLVVNAVRSVKAAVGAINELDGALTEIGIVTNQTREQTARLAIEYNNLAKEMQVTTAEVASAAVTFYRQGLSQAEVMDRLRQVTMYSKITNTEFAQSAELLTATVNSMGVSMENATDVFLMMGDATATSGAEIARGFAKVGGTASALGVEFEKVASWIAVVSSKTRESAQSIGTSMQTILARMSRLTETGFNEEDETRINDVAKALATVNIQLTDSTGTYRNFGTIIDEVANKWDGLDNKTKAYLATTLAGTRQQARLYSLFDGYAESVRLYEESLESAGTTQEKYNRYLESNQAAYDKLKATTEGMWINFINSDALKFAAEFATAIVNVVDKFALLNVAITGLGIGGFAKLLSMLASTKIGMNLMAIATGKATFQLNLLTGALMASPFIKFALIGAGITAFVKFAQSLTRTLKDQKEVVASLSSDLTELQSEYDQLKSIENKTDEQEKYLALLQTEIDLLKDKHKLEKSKEVEMEYFTGRTYKGGGYTVEGGTRADELQKQINKLQELQGEIDKLDEKDGESANKHKKLKEEQREIISDLITAYKTLKDASDVMGEETPEHVKELINNLTQIVEKTDEYKDSLDKLEGKEIPPKVESLTELSKQFDEATSKIQNYYVILDELNSKEGLSAKSKQDIITKYHELLPYLEDEKELRRELINIIAQEEETQKEVYSNMLMSSEEFYNAKILGNTELVNKLNEYYGVDLKNFTSLADAKGNIEAKLINTLSDMWSQHYSNLGSSINKMSWNALRAMEQGLGGYDDAVTQQMLKTHSKLAELGDMFKNISLDFANVDFKGINLGKVKGGSGSSKPLYDFDKDLEMLENFLVKYIKKRGDMEKEAIENWYKMETDALEKLHKEKVDKLKDELDEYKKIVNERIKFLKDEYDEEDYYQELELDQQVARDLQTQIDKLSMDDSIEAKNKRAKLREELQKQNEKIAEKEKKRERDIQTESLQDSIKIREADTNNKIDELNKQYEIEKQGLERIHELKVEAWEKEYANAAIYAEANKAITDGFIKDFEGKMVGLGDAFQEFENLYGRGMGVLGDKTKNEFLDAVNRVTLGLQGLNKEAGYLKDTSGGVSRSIDAVGTSAKKTQDDVKKLTKSLQDLIRESKTYNEMMYYEKQLAGMGSYSTPKGYSQGGKIDYTGLAMVHGSKADPEWVFNNEQFKALAKYIAYEKIKVPPVTVPALSGVGGGFTIGSLINVEGNITEDVMPRVKQATDNVMDKLAELVKLKG